MHQVAAAQVGHLEVDVAQVQAGQVGAAEVQTLKEEGNGSVTSQTEGAGLASPYLAAELGLCGRGQEEAHQLLPGDGRVVLRRPRVL